MFSKFPFVYLLFALKSYLFQRPTTKALIISLEKINTVNPVIFTEESKINPTVDEVI